MDAQPTPPTAPAPDAQPAAAIAATGESSRKKPGRPRGRKTEPRPHVTALRTRCPKCGGEGREPYTNTRTVQASGTEPDGRVYASVTFRDTRCTNPECRQVRCERTPNFVAE